MNKRLMYFYQFIIVLNFIGFSLDFKRETFLLSLILLLKFNILFQELEKWAKVCFISGGSADEVQWSRKVATSGVRGEKVGMVPRLEITIYSELEKTVEYYRFLDGAGKWSLKKRSDFHSTFFKI